MTQAEASLVPANLTPRQRVIRTLNHQPVDRPPLDIGGTVLSGAHVSVIAQLRQRLGLDQPGTPVKVAEPAQMLGAVEDDLRRALRVDVAGLLGPDNVFGFRQTNWKPWKTFDGTDVLVAGQFNTTPDEHGDIVQFPQDDRSAPPSMRMPNGGFYFDAIIRQHPIDDAKLDPRDNCEEFVPVTDEQLAYWEKAADDLHRNTDLGIATGFPGTALGDIFLVPAPWLKDPKGIRDLEEWYISTVARRDYVREVFAYQVDVAIQNLTRLHQAVGDKVHCVFLDGTDLATQNSLFCSPDTYRELYQPYHRKMNDWIHAHTEWKVMKHCCGACEPLIGEFIAAGFDVLNPVQCSASGMDPQTLVDRFGDQIVFWGGGVDTQKTLPFGTPDEVRAEVTERIGIFRQKHGFVFNAIHNIQCRTPVDNVLAMLEAYWNCAS